MRKEKEKKVILIKFMNISHFSTQFRFQTYTRNWVQLKFICNNFKIIYLSRFSDITMMPRFVRCPHSCCYMPRLNLIAKFIFILCKRERLFCWTWDFPGVWMGFFEQKFNRTRRKLNCLNFLFQPKESSLTVKLKGLVMSLADLL